ncbi:carbohydrate ABC transporter permease [Kineococcus rhizosphaerae]|uniref:Carbohydrate ABC transporter membrane protein 2 (CUT1 family) n=1 Tax=Kineococcus rhizosphaerae TaxID=559628 RepID=A0A2T0R7P4_9ACTN|nr:carbohydrate ABC transporter permease [Kineococcus rhizosphaerae]PRY17177.1 carbohydrate ABC transporter membrane protein 2 (CUT1 family) [Kineococcus rhizosphaerae]
MATTATTYDQVVAVHGTGAGERRRVSVGRVLAWTVLGLIMLVTLFPFYWMLRTAFSNGAALSSEPSSLLPVEGTWGAFKRVLGLATTAEAQAQGGSGAALDIGRYLLNSVIVSVCITAGQVFFGAMAAFAFARLRWPGRNLVFFVFLTALMVPPIFTQLPNFLLVRDLGLLNTYAGIILPFFFMTPFAIFFLRQFFLSIPREVEEAARIDGAGAVRRFFRVILPMASGPLLTLTILQYIQAWGEYFWPLLVGSDEKVRVITVGLGIFRAQTPQGTPDWAGLMAGTLLAALPIVILFALFARKIVNSIGFSGIK